MGLRFTVPSLLLRIGFAACIVIALCRDGFADPIGFAGSVSATDLDFNGAAALVTTADGNVIRLVPAAQSKVGSVFTASPQPIETFSTHFQFRVTDSVGADGFAFVVQSVSPNALGGGGGGLGYRFISSSAAIEFDYWLNVETVARDPSDNHVGLDVNGSVHSIQTNSVAPRFDNGALWNAWIDYDGSTMQVRAALNSDRPAGALLTAPLDLVSIVGPNGFVGFTAATGGAYSAPHVLSWEYSSSSTPAPTPEPATLLLCFGGVSFLLPRLLRLKRSEGV